MHNHAANLEAQGEIEPGRKVLKVGEWNELERRSLFLTISTRTRLLARISLCLVIALAPLRYSTVLLSLPLPPIYTGYTSLVIYPADPFLLAALVFWVASLAFQPRRISLQPYGFTFSLAGLTLVSILSTISSVDPLLSLYQSIRLLLLFGLFLFILNEIHSFNWIYLPVGLQVLTQSLVGILQVLEQHSIGLTWLHELALDPSWNGVSIVWSATTRSLRAYGLTDHPNILGGGLALGLIFLAVWYLETRESLRLLVGSLFMLGAIGLLLSFSRSAYLGLLLGLILVAGWLWFNQKKPVLARLALLGVASLILLAPFLWQNLPNLSTRFNFDNSFSTATPENQAINERALLAKQALAIFSAHPLTGTGVGAFPIALYKANPSYPFNFQPPHLVLLDIGAETGVFGAFFYLVIELFPWIYMIARRKQIRFSLALVGASAALLVVTVISLFDYYPWMLNPGQLSQWLVWGLWAGLIATSTHKENSLG